MHVHILGICGTFMGGLALIARSAGHTVTGCDAGVYPPMSTQLEEQGIVLTEGFDASQTSLKPDLFIIGNVVSRGNPLMEAILDQGLPYISGPQWLGQNILQDQHVLAVAGTHGKTTTSAMLAWILESAGLAPNFLVGGIAGDLKVSARYSPDSRLFVIEADEYDTAFFDKRSKFVHYRPRTAILNNLEYDHADIFPDLAAIETQFHHLVRTVPSTGRLIRPEQCDALDRVLERGCWTPVDSFGNTGDHAPKRTPRTEVRGQAGQGPHGAAGAPVTWRGDSRLQAGATHWAAQPLEESPSASRFRVLHKGEAAGIVQWPLSGEHNRNNALAAIAAASHAGVTPADAIAALNRFSGVKRRMELRGSVRQIDVYDDFAHHPTAIATTLEGARKRLGSERRIIAVIEPRSNTMKLGAMAARLAPSLEQADLVFCYGETSGKHALGWNPEEVLSPLGGRAHVHHELSALVADVAGRARSGDTIIVMSNGSFGGIHQKLLDQLQDTPS